MAGSLDFQGIIDLVGNKLREVFGTGNIGNQTGTTKQGNLRRPLYVYEHGVRLALPAMPPSPDGSFLRVLRSRKPLVVNTPAEQLAVGGQTPGTDLSLSAAVVPILAADRALGTISLDNFDARAWLTVPPKCAACRRCFLDGPGRSRTPGCSKRHSGC